jgi:hypothetical protein
VQRNTIFLWHPSDSAATYHLQVSLGSNFSSMVLDTTIADTMFQTDSLAAGTRFYWHVSAANTQGASDYSATVYFTTGSIFVDVKNSPARAERFSLEQNYPNPFNPSTMISYNVPKKAYVKIVIYDMLGRAVATVVDGVRSPNHYQVQWNPVHAGSGVYFCRIQAHSSDGSGDFSAMKKLLFVK